MRWLAAVSIILLLGFWGYVYCFFTGASPFGGAKLVKVESSEELLLLKAQFNMTLKKKPPTTFTYSLKVTGEGLNLEEKVYGMSSKEGVKVRVEEKTRKMAVLYDGKDVYVWTAGMVTPVKRNYEKFKGYIESALTPLFLIYPGVLEEFSSSIKTHKYEIVGKGFVAGEKCVVISVKPRKGLEGMFWISLKSGVSLYSEVEDPVKGLTRFEVKEVELNKPLSPALFSPTFLIPGKTPPPAAETPMGFRDLALSYLASVGEKEPPKTVKYTYKGFTGSKKTVEVRVYAKRLGKEVYAFRVEGFEAGVTILFDGEYVYRYLAAKKISEKYTRESAVSILGKVSEYIEPLANITDMKSFAKYLADLISVGDITVKDVVTLAGKKCFLLEAGGARMWLWAEYPFIVKFECKGKGFTLENLQVNVEIPDDVFKLPSGIKVIEKG